MFFKTIRVFTKTSVKAFSLITYGFLVTSVFAAPGNFDRGFGDRGRVRTSIGNAQNKISSIELQPDGKLVTAGVSDTNGEKDVFLARYNPDGTLDNSFGASGMVLLPISGSSEEVNSVKIQSNGKIVIGGAKTANNDTDFFLARFNTNGSLDNGFGLNGIAISNIGTSADTIRSIAFQTIGSEQRIVAAGSIGVGANSSFAVARYKSDGTLDESFAFGVGVTFVSWGNEDRAEAVVIQRIGNEDKIVLGGKRRLIMSNGALDDDFALARFNSNGSLDQSFGTNGMVNTSFSLFDSIYALAIQDVGFGPKIVAAGRGNNNFALARFHEDGSLDNGFGNNGKVETWRSILDDQINDAVVLSDGRILAGGYERNPEDGHQYFSLVRYLRDGSIDPLFGNCGSITSNLGSPTNVIQSVATQTDGKAIAAGYVRTGTTAGDLALVRYTNNAAAAPSSLDFDGDGRTDASVFRPSDGVWHMNRSCFGYTSFKFGIAGDKPVPADYDGDGKTDVAVYRDGIWYIQNSRDGLKILEFGLSTDIPVAGDFDDDGKADIAIWRPADGDWWVLQSSDGGVRQAHWGQEGDIPVSADYDGDFMTDLAVFRPSTGIWYVLQSFDNSFLPIDFGTAGDIPLIMDVDADLRSDSTVFRPSDQIWYSLSSGGDFSALKFGISTDIPVSGDFDGDGKSDYAVYRQGIWYTQQTKSGFKAFGFGLADDIPLTSR